jgi:hypothetical protein
MHAEVERLGALALPALAAEVMAKSFGAGGPAADGPQEIGSIAGALKPSWVSAGGAGRG